MNKQLTPVFLAICAAILLSTLTAKGANAPDGMPAAIPNPRQYALKSRLYGQTYRLWIATPFRADPAVAYPVLDVLDEIVNFGTVAYTEAKLTHDHEAASAIVVGIGRPTDDLANWSRRRPINLTPSLYKGTLPQFPYRNSKDLATFS
jgi:enterochelin esterase-like enzyme